MIQNKKKFLFSKVPKSTEENLKVHQSRKYSMISAIKNIKQVQLQESGAKYEPGGQWLAIEPPISLLT